MVNEPDEVSSHSKDQPDTALPAQGAGSSPAATPKSKPAAPPDDSATPPQATPPSEPPLTEPPLPGEAAESAASQDVPGSVLADHEKPAEPAAIPDLSGRMPDGEWHDSPHHEEPSNHYHEEEMYGEGTGTEVQTTVPEESSGYATEADYYHHAEDASGGAEPASVSPNRPEHQTGAESDDLAFESDDEEEGVGGPVKSFLEHLEDFRWVIIKSLAAVLVAMVVCLVAIPSLIGFLTWPLRNPWIPEEGTNQVMRLHFGTNLVEMPLATNQLGAFNVGTNRFVDWDLVPVLQGTNWVLTLQPTPEAARTLPIPKVPDLVVIDATEPFVIAIQVAIYGGLGLASPFIMFFVGQFLVPALKKKERKYLYYGVSIGAGLFFAGVAFCYFVLLRVAIYATVQFANWMGFSSNFWRGGGFLSFSIKFMVGMGLMFELPVLLLTLVKIGILDHHKLSKFRPYWVIVNLTLSGFITPSGDPFSMILMAAPIHILYEISYLIARYWAWRDAKREAAEAAVRD